MARYSNEQLMAAFKTLPKDVQEAILSVNTAEVIKQTAEKYRLMIDKAGELSDETGLVMMGFTHPNQFITNLSERLEIDKTIAKEIAEEINSKIFFPIRENLKKIHQIEEETLISEPEIKTGPYEPAPVQMSPTPIFSAPEMPIGADLTEPPKTAEEPIPPPTPPTETPPKPASPDTSQGGPSIFEEKTKEEIFRSAIEVSESASSADLPKRQEPDPYREPII